MSTALTYRDARDVDADRSTNIAAAARVDRDSGTLGGWIGAGLLGVFGGAVAAVTGNESSPMMIAVVYTMLLVQGPWQIDETDGGADLRRVVGLTRRSVVTARYITFAWYWLVFVIAALVAPWTMAAAGVGQVGFTMWDLGSRVVPAGSGQVGAAMFGVWAAAMLSAVSGCFGIAARIRWGSAGSVVLLCLVAVLGPLAIILVGSFGVSDYALRTPGDIAVALGLLLLVVVGGGLVSHRSAIRAYERKDL